MKPRGKLFFAIPPGIGFPHGSEVKNPPTMQETWVQSLGCEDTLEKGMATLQYFCLENSMDRVAWQAPVYGVAESDTAKQLCIFFLL